LAAGAFIAMPSSSAAQGADDAPALFLDVSTGLRHEEQLNEGAFVEALIGFGVGYFTSTHNQRLSFQGGLTLQARKRVLTWSIPPSRSITHGSAATPRSAGT
jgi:hypothetical protein